MHRMGIRALIMNRKGIRVLITNRKGISALYMHTKGISHVQQGRHNMIRAQNRCQSTYQKVVVKSPIDPHKKVTVGSPEGSWVP